MPPLMLKAGNKTWPMPEIDGTLFLRFTLLAPWLVALCVKDVRTRRLPNVWTLGGLAVALAVDFGLGWAAFRGCWTVWRPQVSASFF